MRLFYNSLHNHSLIKALRGFFQFLVGRAEVLRYRAHIKMCFGCPLQNKDGCRQEGKISARGRRKSALLVLSGYLGCGGSQVSAPSAALA